MRHVLEELNKTKGITGSIIVGNDGMVISAYVGEGDNDEIIGAMAAAIVGTVQKSLKNLKQRSMVQGLIEATDGKLFLADVDIGILVAMAEKEVNVGLIRLEMRNAARRILDERKRGNTI